MKAIIVSQEDIAGQTMLASFRSLGFEGEDILRKGEMVVFQVPQDIIHAEGIDALGAELAVFASRHRSAAGTPSLTIHSTGNFGKAEYGGEEETLQNTVANAKHNVYLEMLECELDYEVCLEVTHHGPTGFNTPIFFAEIGSLEKQWRDSEAADFVAGAIVNGLQSEMKFKKAIAFGGGHYAPKFSEMHDIAFSHICPKYAMDGLTEGLVEQMVEKTMDCVDFAVLDEKGLKGHHKVMVRGALEHIGIEY